VAVVIGLTAFFAVYAVAATMGLKSDQLSAGAASVTPCDSDGFTIDVTLDGAGKVTQATVGGIDATCAEGAGGQLTIHHTKADGASIGSGGPVAVTAPSTTVAIAGLPSLAEVAHEVVIIVWP
jgi:hypothetical protein